MSEVEHILACRNKLGEGPVWNEDEQILYWVDIEDNCYWRLHPASGTHEVVNVGVSIGVLALRSKGGLVLATQDGFALWNPHERKLEYIARPFADQPDKRFNDGAVDPAGRFWAGSMGEPETGVLYRLDPDGSVHEMEHGVSTSNGIGWSPDNTLMYYTDSTKNVIYVYDYDLASGSISNRRVFAENPGEQALPDGLVVDSEGHVWSAYWEGAKVVRYAPDGSVERVIQVPAWRPTSCVFGGESLDELYITSAAVEEEQRAEYPLSGDLFRLKTGIRGLPKYKFGG